MEPISKLCYIRELNKLDNELQEVENDQKRKKEEAKKQKN